MLKPEDRISIPEIVNHVWVREDSIDDDDDDEHDLKVGATFFR